MRFAVCRCLRWLVRSSSKIRSMIPVNRTQLWPPRRRASAIPWRHRERQHLTDRLAVYTKHPRGLAGAHPLDMTRPPNPCVQLHPIHPPRLPVRATLTEGYTRSPFWSAAAGSTGRFSGGLLLCLSQPTSARSERWLLRCWRRRPSPPRICHMFRRKAERSGQRPAGGSDLIEVLKKKVWRAPDP